MKRFLVLLASIFYCTAGYSQTAPAVQRVQPTNWWVGMKNPNLQLLVYGPKAGSLTYSINYPGVRLASTSKVENPNYAFLNLVISPSAKPGTVKIVGRSARQTVTHAYELKARQKDAKRVGVNKSDLVYLIMPDRFANGDPSNDKFPGMLDTAANAANPYLRHGGDLQGIINHLDYLQELGVTTLWLTPVIENDETLKAEAADRMQAGYHGYHFTEHYEVDRRFGGNKAYKQLSDALHQRGMKLVQDAVYNHVSDDHWMFKDRPTKDWFNNWPAYTNTSHKEQPLLDPHRADIDHKVFIEGWFTAFLPDLNQRNPFLANYLIQHAIWSTETFSLDGWRIDTYKYNDQAFMNRCNAALLAEFPHILLFGETVANNPLNLSYFVKSKVAFPFKSNLPSTLDFPLNYAILDALRQDFGWDQGVSRLYSTLSQDVVYADPMMLVTSLDNHDMNRYYSEVGEDFDKYKMGVAWLLTTRGIPSLYYGTEILMKNFKNPTDAEVRRNFPGGFPGDKDNAFIENGRSKQENEAFAFVQKLAQYRKRTPALYAGQLTQYIPQEGVYVYFRHNNEKTIMVASNSTSREMAISTDRFAERMKGFSTARNVVTDAKISNLSELKIPAKTVLVLELGK
jgi:glycosidase